MMLLGYWYGVADVGKNKTILPTETKGIPLGKMISPFTLGNLNGLPVTVGQPGKVIVISFWNTWSLPCQTEMLILDDFYQTNQQRVLFYGINIQESPQEIQDFMQTNHYQIPILLDQDGEVSKMFQVNSIPTTIIINKHGMIKYRKSGVMIKEELEGITNSL